MATYYDLVRRFHPRADDAECEYLLWEATAYPYARLMTIARQLKKSAVVIKQRKSVCMRCGELYENSGKVSFDGTCGCI